ncbi:hypothetical protein SAMN05660742_1343 [Propionispira arboris]|uniref:Sce7726 family protein n=1 Tax=Propionispira arboris TaxID=84035 RepID=A0A1H7D941_9FIRM|nr:sce7726 family protein [Propionispira arboris]SEJ97397.1 hypothetical protein SAMN05660742_1343 [Propionispira arboris]
MYDIDIRIILKEYLAQEFANTHSIIVDEFKICWGDARVDIAVVNSNLHGYEIKSDNDTLDRLPRQIEFYGKVFDTMSIVCSKKWLSESRQLIPSWWGIVVAEEIDGRVFLQRRRKERLNKKIDVRSVLELTWKGEALGILEAHNAVRGFKSKPRWDIWDRIIELLDKESIKRAVRTCIKGRDGWRSAETMKRLIKVDLQ